MVLRLRYDHWLSIASPLLNPYSSVLFDFSSKKHLIRAFHLNICLPMVADTNWLGSPEFLTDFHTSLTNGFILLENCFFFIIKIINVYSNFSSSLYLSFFQFLIKNFSSLSLNQL